MEPLRYHDRVLIELEISDFYFCDPYNSSQKAECESNHRLCRYGIGKKGGVDRRDIRPRRPRPILQYQQLSEDSLGWRSPFRAFKAAFPESGAHFHARPKTGL